MKDDQGVTCLVRWMKIVALTILIILLVTLRAIEAGGKRRRLRAWVAALLRWLSGEDEVTGGCSLR